MLMLLGSGVVATAVLPGSKGAPGSWLQINVGWGLAVFSAVTVSYASGAHINPAVTLGIIATGATQFTAEVPVGWLSTFTYLGGQLIGAFLGSSLAWLAYKRQFDQEADGAAKRACFCTTPELPGDGWAFVNELIGTFVLVFVVLGFGRAEPAGLAALGALPVALLVVGIGTALGGPTGYAINPARDFGPRLAHAVLPIPGKVGSDWGYAWVPVLGPVTGGLLAGLASQYLLPL